MTLKTASPAAENEAQVVTGAETDASASVSSPEGEKDAPLPNLLDVVKSAVEPENEAAGESSAPEQESGEASAEAGEAEAGEGTEAKAAETEAEDDAKLPFHNHPRFRQLIDERNSLRGPAEQMGKIQSFMDEAGLTPEEVAEGYQVMAMLKSGDPAQLTEAREYFATRLQALDNALGNSLPDDLQQRIDDGYLDEEGAREIARSRASEHLRAEREKVQTQRTEAEKARDNQVAQATAMAEAVDGWEKQVKANDPDYSKKAPFMEAACLAIVRKQGKNPSNAEEAIALAKAAYEQVTNQLKTLAPPKKPTAPKPSNEGKAASPAPTSLRGAIAAALAG